MGWHDLTCMRFMASRIWSRWWAELRASRRMSVNFSSFSRSSFFSWSTISASASVHSHSLRFGFINREERRGWGGGVVGHLHSYSSTRVYRHRFNSRKRERRKENWSQERKALRQLGREGWEETWSVWDGNSSPLQSDAQVSKSREQLCDLCWPTVALACMMMVGG